MIRIKDIKIREEINDKEVINIVCRKYKLNIDDVVKWSIYRKSIDARNKNDIFYVYTIDLEIKDYKSLNQNKYKNIEFFTEKELLKLDVNRKSNKRPVIIGAGPAGLFAALKLIEYGITPIIIEQGKKVEDRKRDIDEFFLTGKLNITSNIQFGEGGAGTFSDGKIVTGISNPYCREVLKTFCRFGAPEQIMYVNKPHIGTDNLIKIISNMRNYILSNGGEFLFENKVKDFEIVDGKITAVTCNTRIETDAVILAIGHSARDTFEKLYELGIKMDRKNFSVGVRIEHKQEMINRSQYSDNTKLKLPPAEYKLVYHGKKRTCYTFCMCPGGEVVASSSEYNTIVTNGMSRFARDGVNANSALLVNVTPEDFGGTSPLEGIYFQKKLEESAFILGGSNYFAPVQRVKDFLDNKCSEKLGNIIPTYKPGIKLSNLNEILPKFVSDTLKEGILYFDKKITGFATDDAVLTGVETRSSSPVTITRNSSYMSNIYGLYPCGEGAGYAGGIMSAAVDGINCAIAVMKN